MTIRAIYDVPAPAKLNLFLHVVGRRADGYHLLQSLFVLIDWCDGLHFERRDDGRLSRRDLGAELPADDLCLRAARALQSASGCRAGVEISVDKQVPWGAGMGGGSSDAASTLLALNRLWGLRWPRSRLMEIGLRLGADVPFFLGGHNALVEGIGERLSPVVLAPRWLAVLKPPTSIETGAIFDSPLVRRDTEVIDAAILAGFSGESFAVQTRISSPTESVIDALIKKGRNDLQPAAEGQSPEVAHAARLLANRFGNSRMTGSGSAVFATAGLVAGSSSVAPAMLENAASGWTGRMCRSLPDHPLRRWAEG